MSQASRSPAPRPLRPSRLALGVLLALALALAAGAVSILGPSHAPPHGEPLTTSDAPRGDAAAVAFGLRPGEGQLVRLSLADDSDCASEIRLEAAAHARVSLAWHAGGANATPAVLVVSSGGGAPLAQAWAGGADVRLERPLPERHADWVEYRTRAEVPPGDHVLVVGLDAADGASNATFRLSCAAEGAVETRQGRFASFSADEFSKGTGASAAPWGARPAFAGETREAVVEVDGAWLVGFVAGSGPVGDVRIEIRRDGQVERDATGGLHGTDVAYVGASGWGAQRVAATHSGATSDLDAFLYAFSAGGPGSS